MNKRNTNLAATGKLNKSNSKPSDKRKKRKKNTTRETIEAILVALIAAMILRAFVVQAFRIPTGSMKDTLLVGDFLLVNKFIYGVRTPDGIPYPVVKAGFPFLALNFFSIPPKRLPAFKKPKNGDVVVFKYPEDPSLDYIKRCIAIGGQTIEVRSGDVFIDGKPEGKKTELGRKFDPDLSSRRYDRGEIVIDDSIFVKKTKMTTPLGKEYVIRHHVGRYDDRNELDNFGPVTVPEGHYFMMGDNRDNSADSRSWGFLPEENVVGEALVIYFSWDKTGAIWNLLESVRWSRVANLIH